MTRTGKIARLPRMIREQLNRRLEDGEPGADLVAWLNAQPQVQAVLKTEFMERPISEQNLSEWKLGGYVDWQKHQEAMELTRDLSANADELAQVAGDPLADRLSPLLAARYMAAIRVLHTAADEDANNWKMLRELWQRRGRVAQRRPQRGASETRTRKVASRTWVSEEEFHAESQRTQRGQPLLCACLGVV